MFICWGVPRLHNGYMSCSRTLFLQWLPRNLPYCNMRTCVICAWVHRASQKKMDHLWCMSMLESNLLAHGNVFMAKEVRAIAWVFFQCIALDYICNNHVVWWSGD